MGPFIVTGLVLGSIYAVSVLGHPTGRLLLTRKGVDADMEKVLAAALESGCAVEINGSPHRLDVDWRLA